MNNFLVRHVPFEMKRMQIIHGQILTMKKLKNASLKRDDDKLSSQ
jgi:hypothetical protein